MAGFDEIKRKLEVYNKDTDSFDLIFEDTEPYNVPYEKCYENEEIVIYNYMHFDQLVKELKISEEGYYQFSVDTLDAYINTVCEYKIRVQPTIELLKSNLD